MLRAVIFDVDGVLVDSYRPHLESWRRLAAEHGFELTEADFAGTFGRTSRDIIRALWPGDLDAAAVRLLDARKEAYYREIVTEEFPAMDGAGDLIDALHDGGVNVAVGSSGPPENVALVLDRLGRRDRIAAVVHGMDVTRGKPDPQVFLLAAERLGVAPEGCVVIEDAPDGIRAARAAGMAGVALVSTGRAAEDFVGVGARRIVRSLRELSPEALHGLVD